jgi:outer membrane protein assembly factor BamB
MFRGPNASGVSESARPPVAFGPDQNVRWVAELPGSPSSPCVWGDRIFVTAFHESKLQTRCYDRASGKLLWTRVTPHTKLEEFHATEGSPAASTPATDGSRVVSYFGSSGLVCHDFDGAERWRLELPTADTAGGFGSGTSPLLAGGRVFLNRDQARQSSLLAVDLLTGRKVWERPRPDASTSYGTPILWRQSGGDEIVVPGSVWLRAYAVADGGERWAASGFPSYACTTAVVGEDGLLFFAGWSPGKSDSPWPSWEATAESQDRNKDGIISLEEYPDGPVWFKAQDIDRDGKITRQDWDAISNQMKRGENVLAAVKPGGRGNVTATHVAWTFSRGLPYVPSPLAYRGRVYIVKDGGMASSFDARTGKPHYVQERLGAAGTYYASPVAADGRLYFVSLQGVVTVVKAGGETPELLHQVKFEERIDATPALVESTIYLRTASKLYALGK